MMERCCFGVGRFRLSENIKLKVLKRSVFHAHQAIQRQFVLRDQIDYDLSFLCLKLFCQSRTLHTRAMALRLVRIMLTDMQDIDLFVEHLLPIFVSRSLEKGNEIDEERIQALKCIRAVMDITKCKHVPHMFVMSLCSIGESFSDPLSFAAVELLCEMTLLNTKAAVLGGAVKVMVKVMLDHPVRDSYKHVLSVIICMLNCSRRRKYLRPGMDIEMLLSPFTDAISEERIRENDSSFARLKNAKTVILQLLRSWAGALYLFSSPRE